MELIIKGVKEDIEVLERVIEKVDKKLAKEHDFEICEEYIAIKLACKEVIERKEKLLKSFL